MRLRSVAAVCLTLAVATSARAQTGSLGSPPSDARIARLLRSTTATEVAWGAYWTSHLRRAEFVPDLIRVLERPPTGADADRQLVAFEALDALVRLDATVPPAVLRPYFQFCPVQVLLLWRQPAAGRDELLLSLLRDAEYDRWFGLANLLLRTKPAGLAAALVKAPLSLHIMVTDAGVEGGIIGGTVGGVASNRPEPAAPHPPVPHYRFFWSGRGVSVLSTGPRTLYYERRVTPDWGARFGTSITGPTPAERAAYLAALAETTFAVPHSVSIPWSGAQDLERRIRAAASTLRDEYDRVLGQLVDRGLLERAAALRLSDVIDVSMTDLRSSRSVPLPAIAPLRRADGNRRGAGLAERPGTNARGCGRSDPGLTPV